MYIMHNAVENDFLASLVINLDYSSVCIFFFNPHSLDSPFKKNEGGGEGALVRK